nr:hypothetical protein Iba_chr09cCG9560 [Ipomoea batatas]
MVTISLQIHWRYSVEATMILSVCQLEAQSCQNLFLHFESLLHIRNFSVLRWSMYSLIAWLNF